MAYDPIEQARVNMCKGCEESAAQLMTLCGDVENGSAPTGVWTIYPDHVKQGPHTDGSAIVRISKFGTWDPAEIFG